MLNITNHYGNANRNYSEIPCHNRSNGYYKNKTEMKVTSVGKRVEKWEPCPNRGEWKMVQLLQKTVRRFCQKVKPELWPSNFPSGYVYSKDLKAATLTHTCTPMLFTSVWLTATLFTTRPGSKVSVHCSKDKTDVDTKTRNTRCRHELHHSGHSP